MKKRIRLWLGVKCNVLSWYLLDPHDAWVIDYRNEDGRLCCLIHRGTYSTARIRAREFGGKIVGHGAKEIEA